MNYHDFWQAKFYFDLIWFGIGFCIAVTVIFAEMLFAKRKRK